MYFAMQTAQNTYIALLLITTTANKEPGLKRCCVGGGAGPATEQLIAGHAGGRGPWSQVKIADISEMTLCDVFNVFSE